ncbi:hypothetical protein ACWGH3_21740 [Streptomyces sp. NPDC054884]|uniref:hypothetical protein n=1 Tax=Streptomyces sp. ME08-AFT2 TaxID=3028683 RepID=UPI0029A74B19|nr:hypothetical protein [Streptomyces sp. ME08-AFT2]MDX3307529.1 hypothetical protein [Streptomyces sp. ME08-AFT2]
MKFVKNRYAPVAALLVCCCLPLAACGTERPGTQAAGSQSAGGSSARDETGDDGEENLPDTTSDDQGSGPDTTTDDQGTLPDTTSDDQGALPDTTTDDQGDGRFPGDMTADNKRVPTEGPHRWFPMLREFRAFLGAGVPKADAAVAAHVKGVHVRVPPGSDRRVAVVNVDYSVWDQAEIDRTARVFARWRTSVYGDHGRVQVLGLWKTIAELDW